MKDQEMEMPCLCDCGEWFDLNDGYPEHGNGKKVICPDCHRKEQNSLVTIGSLRKGDKFLDRYDDLYTVVARYTKKNEYLLAVNEFDRQEKFQYEDDEVRKR